MASMASLFAGRKKESSVWNWFSYNPENDKSMCMAPTGTEEDICGFQLRGRNSTNLKTHLSRKHPLQFKEMIDQEKAKSSQSVCSETSNQKKMSTQTLASCLRRKIVVWPPGSVEHEQRLNSLLNMIISTGNPVTLVDNSSFRAMMKTLDPKFALPASGKVNTLLNEKMKVGAEKLKNLLSSSRRVTICLDGWTKKGLTSSFLGISVCFFDPSTNQPQHALLALESIQHPHTGLVLSQCLEKCLLRWDIPKEKVLLIISDNGANMVKAIALLRDRSVSVDAAELDEEEEQIDEDTERGEDLGYNVELPLENVSYRRLGCLAHTVQLIVKEAYQGHYSDLIAKSRALVGKVKKSSVIVQKVIEKCGKCVLGDNMTRWNSTYRMVKRLLEIRGPLNEILCELNIDTMVASEWIKLEEFASLVEPFADQTDILQTDYQSASSIIPSLLDLECHLEEFPAAKPVTRALLQDIRTRFSVFLNSDDPGFNPVPAAACLLDPSCAQFILGFEHTALRDGAKDFILKEMQAMVLQCATLEGPTPESEVDQRDRGQEPSAKRWKYLQAKQRASTAVSRPTSLASGMQSELSKYLIEIRNGSRPNETTDACKSKSIEFWLDRQSSYPHLAPVALDIISAPASQAFVERIFSLCGMLTVGRRNRMEKSLEMRVFLKLNDHLM